MKEFSKQIVSFLEHLSIKCWKSSLYRFILFSVATIFAINFMGYHFGTFDQSIHIPFLKKIVDPTLYPTDPFLDLRLTHYSFFWFLFIPFYKLGILEISMFITYVCVIYLTFYAVWKLTNTLFRNPFVSFLSVIVFTIPHLGFGLLTLIEFSLLNRTFVLPFLLFSIDAYLNKRYLTAYLMLGVLYNLHVLSVNFVLAMFIFDAFFSFKYIGWRKILSSIIFFIVPALPVLIWKMNMSPVDFTIRPEWFAIISNGFLYHIFTLISANPKIILLTLGGIASLLLFYIGLSLGPKSDHHRVVNHFMSAALLILVVEFITSQWLPITIIIQSQIMRVSIFMILFGYLYFVHYLVSWYQKEKGRIHERFLLLIFIILLSISPLTIPIIWLIQKRFSSIRLLRILTCFAGISFVGTLVLASSLRIWSPGIYIFPKKNAEYDVQMWARTHTPKDAFFITPPYPWLMLDLEWRIISERPTIAHLGELGEIAFAPEYLSYWLPRFNALVPGSLEKFKGDVFENKEIIREAFYRLTTNDIKQIAQKYKASHLVVEKPHTYGFQEVYENGVYRVYRITK